MDQRMGGEDLAGACIDKHIGPIEGFLGVDVELPGEPGPRLAGHRSIPYHQFSSRPVITGIAIPDGRFPCIHTGTDMADGVFQCLAGRA